jgi:hypothetical protein
VVWDLEYVKQLYSLDVEELKDAKNLGYHISKEPIQVPALHKNVCLLAFHVPLHV